MIRIAEIGLDLNTERGAVSGQLKLDGGLHVVTADNRYGKSLAFASLAWCLGVEQIYGVATSDLGFLPDAARRAVQLGNDREIPVVESTAHVTLLRNDGAQLRLSRAVVGGDIRHIQFETDEASSVVMVGSGSSKNAVAGFQHHFRRWAGLSEARLTRPKGESPIYLENLAPLFLIEQLRGWTDIQAEQVHRYGLADVEAAAVEYLLGMDGQLASRLQRQRAELAQTRLRAEARVLAERFEQVLGEHGWTASLSVGNDLAKTAQVWQALDVIEYVRDKFNYDYASERSMLLQRLSALRKELAVPSGTDVASGAVETSQQLIELKHQRHEAQSSMRGLRAQLDEQVLTLRTVEDRLSAAKDLRRLREQGVGVLSETACPTCHQTVSPSVFGLDDQPTHALKVEIATLNRQRAMLSHSMATMKTAAVAAKRGLAEIEEKIAITERTLGFVNATVGSANEAVLAIAGRIAEVERELAMNQQIQQALGLLQDALREWAVRASSTDLSVKATEKKAPQLVRFESRLKSHIAALGVGGVTGEEAKKIRLDKRYRPLLLGQSLPTYGSASDRARLVMAYVVALLQSGDGHPGFAVLDEPVQQNPDAHHLDRLLDRVCELALPGDRQLVVFSNLKPAEVERLEAAGVRVSQLKDRFLAPIERGTGDR